MSEPMKPLGFYTLLISALLVFHSCSDSKNKGTQGKENSHSETASKPDVIEPHAAFDTLRDGDFTLRYPSGVIQLKGFYANGKREGEWAAFFPSGKMQSEGYFTHGRRDHQATVYYENGNKMYEGTYKDGVMTGVWKYYNSDGSLSKTVDCGEKK